MRYQWYLVPTLLISPRHSCLSPVIPAKAGIQSNQHLDSCFRRNDEVFCDTLFRRNNECVVHLSGIVVIVIWNVIDALSVVLLTDEGNQTGFMSDDLGDLQLCFVSSCVTFLVRPKCP